MRILTAVLVAALLVPAGASAQQDLRSPDARDAARPALTQDLRSPDTRDAQRPAVTQDLRNPDSRDYGLQPRELAPTSSLAGTTSPEGDGPATWPWLAFAVVIVAAFAATAIRRRKAAVR
jgi:hypothetical protein